MELRRLVPFPDEAARQPADHVVVLGVDHRQGAHPPRRRQHVEELAVVEADQVVGHVDLEGNDALGDQLRDLFFERLRRWVGDDQVEPVVGHRLRPRRRVVGGDHFPGRGSLPLDGKREDSRRPAANRRNGARVVVVGAHQPHRGLLLDMCVGVHAPRNDQPVLRGNLFPAAPQSRLDGPDHPAADADVRGPDPVGGHHRPAPYDGVEFSHRKRAILSDRDGGLGAPASRRNGGDGLERLPGETSMRASSCAPRSAGVHTGIAANGRETPGTIAPCRVDLRRASRTDVDPRRPRRHSLWRRRNDATRRREFRPLRGRCRSEDRRSSPRHWAGCATALWVLGDLDELRRQLTT